MYQFLKTHFSLLMCFLVILMGCTNRKISREFSDTMEDGSCVVIKIEYKPKSFMNPKGEKFGSYYFIAKHFFSPGQNAKADSELTAFEKLLLEKSRSRLGNVYISFYDQEGHLLLKGFTPDKDMTPFLSGPVSVISEENSFDGGIEWKGRFNEGLITLENFRDIHSITAQWR